MDNNEWRKLIVDHYSNPINFRKVIDNQYNLIDVKSNLCVDNFKIGLKIKDDSIQDAIFNGLGCAISTSSIDLMIEEIKGIEIKKAIFIIENYFKLIYQQKFDLELLGKLIVFSNIYKQPNRIKCATIGINGILEVLKNIHE